MFTSFAIAAFIILSALSLLAIAAMARAMIDSIRQRRSQTYVPVADPNPPAEVAPSHAMVLLVTLAGVWAAAHLGGLAYWLATGELIKVEFRSVALGSYVGVAAGITAIGAVLLGMRKAFGRRVVAWGQFLFGIMAFMGGLVALLLPGQEDVPQELKAKADVLLFFCVGHLMMDTLIGSLSQRLAKAKASGQSAA